jgi:hypothetical protein
VNDYNDTPSDRLTEFGVPVDALNDFLQEKLGESLRQHLGGVSEAARLAEASPYLRQHAASVAGMIQSNPELAQRAARVLQADPRAGIDYLESVHRASTGSGGGPLNVYERPLSVEEARAEYERTGSPDAAKRYAKARLHTVITDEFLNQ